MLSPSERRKNNFAKALLPPFGAEMRKYEEIYQLYTSEGYNKELCELYADTFVNEVKKPAPEDIIQVAKLFDRIHDSKSADFYLEMLAEKKLSGDDKYYYCIEMLKTQSKLGRWRDAEDFRTENINFMQNYSQKKSLQQQADLYIALALVDCAAKNYNAALKLMNFGYKPHGKNDVKLLEMMITGVYLYAQKYADDSENADNEESLATAISSAKACLKLFSEFEFSWSREYYQQCIRDASMGVL